MAVKPILCLDFDGVLHSYTSGWKGADVIPDPPVDGAVEFVQMAKEHFTVCVFSSRSHQDGGIEAMKKWMREYGFPEVEFPENKPPAHVTIDDRGLNFDGIFPDIEKLLNFKPWNKRICEHDGCDKIGVSKVSGSDYDTHIRFYCRDHAIDFCNNLSSEFLGCCPNCGCQFGVN